MNATALPQGTAPLLTAELKARQLDGWAKNGLDIPRITRRAVLPSFEYDVFAPFLWPRSASGVANLMFEAMRELETQKRAAAQLEAANAEDFPEGDEREAEEVRRNWLRAPEGVRG